MSAGSGPSCSLLSGSDPVEAIEQENGVPVDDVLRPVNSFHGALKRGSVESLKVSLRCGANEKAFQMRCTVETDTPDVLAIERVLQCVASAGIVSSVFVTTSAIFSSPILRGAPQRGSSSRPSKRFGKPLSP